MQLPPSISHGEILAVQTGRKVSSIEDWNKSDMQRAVLLSQSDRIAKRLEAGGVPMRSQSTITKIGFVSGAMSTTREYRNSNLLPHIQARNVHDMFQHVAYWMDQTNKHQRRMWVVSDGWVSLSEYRERHMAFTRRISKFANNKILQEAGIELSYYTIENTVCIDEVTGERMLNLHAHILVKTSRKLGSEWNKLLSWVKGYWPKEYLHDSKISNAAECVKYVFKPTDFEKLTNEELVLLYNQTYKLKFFVPLGEMRSLRADMRRGGLKLRKIHAKGRSRWRVLQGYTREPIESTSNKDTNQIVALTAPSPAFSPEYEPCLIVRNLTIDPQELIEKNNWLDFQQKVRQLAFEKGIQQKVSARKSIGDTTTTTVQSWRGSENLYPEYQAHFNDPPDQSGYFYQQYEM